MMNEDRIATNFRMTRLVRTQSSEIYLIWDDDRRLGQLDLHYAHDTIHATLVLTSSMPACTEEKNLYGCGFIFFCCAITGKKNRVQIIGAILCFIIYFLLCN